MTQRPRRVGLRVVGIGAVVGLWFASVSLLAAWVVVRLLGLEPDTAALVAITVATLVGASTGGWWAQPRVTRLIDAIGKQRNRR